MTAKKRLISTAEVNEHLLALRRVGVDIAGIDIRADGVTFYPPGAFAPPAPGNDFDRWKHDKGREAKDQDRDRAPPR